MIVSIIIKNIACFNGLSCVSIGLGDLRPDIFLYYVNIAAHELRTPIQPILGMTGILI